MVDNWELVKRKLRAKRFDETQILEIYECIVEVAGDKGVKKVCL